MTYRKTSLLISVIMLFFMPVVAYAACKPDEPRVVTSSSITAVRAEISDNEPSVIFIKPVSDPATAATQIMSMTLQKNITPDDNRPIEISDQKASVSDNAVSMNEAPAHEHDLDCISNGDGTHYTYCTHPPCDFELTEPCENIDGVCPYCGYKFPSAPLSGVISPAPDECCIPDYAPSYDKYDGLSYEDIIAADDSYESTDILNIGIRNAYVDSYGNISTDWYYFTVEEIEILAQVMLHEAGNQCEAGKIGVVEVILNRMQSPFFSENTVKGIVYSAGQFSFVERSRSIIPSDEDLSLVQDIILGNKRVFNSPDVLYFRNPMITSGIPAYKMVNWGNHVYVSFIEDHAFYRQ